MRIWYCLPEICFITNANDMRIYNQNFDRIMDDLARAIGGANFIQPTPPPQPQVPAVPPAVTGQNILQYSVHVQNRGWMAWVRERIVAGTTGLGLRLEAIRIAISNIVGGGGIRYRVHVQNVGWQDWVANGAIAGTTGRGLRAEAIRIELTGELARTHRIEYRVHIQNIGWMPWVSDGAIAGTTGRSLRTEQLKFA